MSEYIELNSAVCIADYAADEHPYEKDTAKPETFSEYNQGWNDACDYIRDKLETEPAADVAPVIHSYWETYSCSQFMGTDEWGEPKWRDGRFYICHNYKCRRKTAVKSNYCPNCGARMDLEAIDNG